MKTFQRIIIFLTLTSILLAACGGSSAGKAESSRAREKSPSVSETDLQTLVDGNNAFALDLYQALRSEGGNLVFSPFSISLALAMTYSGARGETESQMADVLHFGSQEQTHPAFNALDLALEDSSLVLDKEQEPMQLNIANSVWAEQTFTFLPDFLDTLAVNYGAGIYLLDFVNNPEPSRKEINNWVSDETEDKINDLLPEGAINPSTKMVLTNAIYFKADWADQFEANDTYEYPFHLLDGTETTVNMMSQDMQIPYVSGNGYQAVELPYAENSAVMNIIVPDEGRYEEIESALTPGFFNEVLEGMQETSIGLKLPKFEIESSFSLAKTLEEMGMPAAFNPDSADFSGMTGKQNLYIGNVIHKAFVAVDEKGTEAAAATAVILMETAAYIFENQLVIDRPFIYFIRDAESGQILFVGRVLNPK